MKPSLLKSMVRKRVREVAFENLIIKKNDGQKDLFIQYEKPEMAAYFSSKSNISVTNKLEMFAIRCEMNDLPSNFGNKTICEMGCQNQMINSEHMLSCPVLNISTKKIYFLQILNVTNKQKIQRLNNSIKTTIEEKNTSGIQFHTI